MCSCSTSPNTVPVNPPPASRLLPQCHPPVGSQFIYTPCTVAPSNVMLMHRPNRLLGCGLCLSGSGEPQCTVLPKNQTGQSACCVRCEKEQKKRRIPIMAASQPMQARVAAATSRSLLSCSTSRAGSAVSRRAGQLDVERPSSWYWSASCIQREERKENVVSPYLQQDSGPCPPGGSPGACCSTTSCP